MKRGETQGKKELKAPVADASSVESPFIKKPSPKHNQTPMSQIDIFKTDPADASNAKKEPEPLLKRFFLWLSMLPLVAVGIDVTQAAHGTGTGTTISAPGLPKPEKAKSDPTSGERSVKVNLTFGEKEHDETDISKQISEIEHAHPELSARWNPLTRTLTIWFVGLATLKAMEPYWEKWWEEHHKSGPVIVQTGDKVIRAENIEDFKKALRAIEEFENTGKPADDYKRVHKKKDR